MRSSQLMNISFIAIADLIEPPYSNILGYPRATKHQLRSRITELQKLGVNSIAFTGPTLIGNIPILGKGYVGVVVLARLNGKIAALKIRRTDSPREGLEHEATILKLVNESRVGPKLFAASTNFVVMEYIDGIKISKWIRDIQGTGSVKRLKDVIRKVLNDCYVLDQAGIDHGELSNISKHVLVGNNTALIDFESASTKRKPSNITSATQAIFIGSNISKRVQRIYTLPPKSNIITALKIYKQQPTRTNFSHLLKTLKL